MIFCEVNTAPFASFVLLVDRGLVVDQRVCVQVLILDLLYTDNSMKATAGQGLQLRETEANRNKTSKNCVLNIDHNKDLSV